MGDVGAGGDMGVGGAVGARWGQRGDPVGEHCPGWREMVLSGYTRGVPNLPPGSLTGRVLTGQFLPHFRDKKTTRFLSLSFLVCISYRKNADDPNCVDDERGKGDVKVAYLVRDVI